MLEDCILFIGPLKRREIVIVEVNTLIDQFGKDLDWPTVLSYSVGDIALKLQAEEWCIKEKREIVPEDHLFFAMTAQEQQTLFDLGFFRRKAVGPLAIIYIDYASQFLPTYRTHCQGVVSAQSSPASMLSILREDGKSVPSIETFKYLVKLSVRKYLENNGPFPVGPNNILKNPLTLPIPVRTTKYLLLRHSYGIQLCDRSAHVGQSPGVFHSVDARIYPGNFKIDALERVNSRKLEELRARSSTFQDVYRYVSKLRQKEYAVPVLYIIHHFYPFA